MSWWKTRYGQSRADRAAKLYRGDPPNAYAGWATGPGLGQARTHYNGVAYDGHIEAPPWVPNVIRVRSQRWPTQERRHNRSSSAVYRVSYDETGATGCTCEDYARRGSVCKHQLAVNQALAHRRPPGVQTRAARRRRAQEQASVSSRTRTRSMRMEIGGWAW